MTDLTVIEQQERRPVCAPAFRTPAFMIPSSYEAIEMLAAKLCAARWVPKSYMDKSGNPVQPMVEVAIMHGLDVGLPPLAAVQNIAVINGMPSIWGDGMLALVESSGMLEDAQEVYEGQGDELSCVCTYIRRGRQTPIVSRFSVAMAKRSGLWSKQGPWAQYPSRMLKMRARSWGLRDGFSDVLKGLRMAEEVLDMGQGADGVYQIPADAPKRPSRPQVAKRMAEDTLPPATQDASAVQMRDEGEPHREVEPQAQDASADQGSQDGGGVADLVQFYDVDINGVVTEELTFDVVGGWVQDWAKTYAEAINGCRYVKHKEAIYAANKAVVDELREGGIDLWKPV